MRLGEPANKTNRRVIWGIIFFFAILFAIAFWNEIRWFFGVQPKNPEQVLRPEAFVIFVGFGSFFLVALLWIALISFQALLPITDFVQDPLKCLNEAYRTAWHLVLNILGLQGPAVSVIDGKVNATAEDLNRENRPGVVVVDFNSAVVLEELNPPPGMALYMDRALSAFLSALQLMDARKSPRVCGAGIVFTRPRERIRGVVDLRKQFRMEKEVRCYTREGIELYANVIAVFTIGQDPDILQVTYVGEQRPENLRVVTMESKAQGFQRITGFADDLDEADREEIHRFLESQPGLEPYSALPNTSRQAFNENRVFAAVYAQARNGKQEVLPWDKLPTRVAAGLYREQLIRVNYDELYDIKGEGEQFPLPEYRSKLRLAMRNNGILAFRYIKHRSGALIKNRVYREEELYVSQVRPLENSKVLRDRGIKIIASSFGELIPVNEAVYLQRLNAWRTAWERELELNQANHELAALRIRGRAHAQAQQDLWRSLRQIFDQRDFSDEALALRILQALNQAAADPRTRALLPANTIDLLSRLNAILLPVPPPNPPQGTRAQV